MIYDYPCLYDYLKDDDILIECVSKIFAYVKGASTQIFQDLDNELISELAFTYYYGRYKRPLTTLYYHKIKVLDLTDTEAVEAFFTHVGKVAYSRFGANWEAIYKAYFATPYKPLENYDMEQKRTPLLDTTNTTSRKQETKVETKGSTSIVPFNDDEPTLTGETFGDSTTTEDKTKNEIVGKIEERGTDTLTRHGNIGVTTSQQMLQSELDLRKLDFQKRIFDDLDKIIVRNYYDGEEWIL